MALIDDVKIPLPLGKILRLRKKVRDLLLSRGFAGTFCDINMVGSMSITLRKALGVKTNAGKEALHKTIENCALNEILDPTIIRRVTAVVAANSTFIAAGVASVPSKVYLGDTWELLRWTRVTTIASHSGAFLSEWQLEVMTGHNAGNIILMTRPTRFTLGLLHHVGYVSRYAADVHPSNLVGCYVFGKLVMDEEAHARRLFIPDYAITNSLRSKNRALRKRRCSYDRDDPESEVNCPLNYTWECVTCPVTRDVCDNAVLPAGTTPVVGICSICSTTKCVVTTRKAIPICTGCQQSVLGYSELE